ncbi:unnamed protein product [Cunninghamella blakesleeana]
MQENNTWSSPPTQESSYVHVNYPFQPIYVQENTNNMMPLSQPNTPRPETSQSHPLSPLSSSSQDNSSLHKRRISEHASSFQTLPYPTSPTRNRRRTESSSSFFETGPTFTPTKQLLEIWNLDQSNSYQTQINVKMERGFFRTDQDWTCYRRNYFQLSATFDVHGMNYMIQGPEVPCLVKDDQQQQLYQVEYFSIGINAFVAGGEKKVDLIQHTPKRDKGPQMIPQPRPLRAGGNLHLAPVGSNHNIVTFERMQFKTATANNGKRRAAQQYYELVVDLYANTTNGHMIRVATCTSAPLVVRGRSPGHYADSNNHPHPSTSSPSTSTANTTIRQRQASDSILHDHYHLSSVPPPPPMPHQSSLSTPLSSQSIDRYHPSSSQPLPPPPLPPPQSRYLNDFNHYQGYPQQQQPSSTTSSSSSSTNTPTNFYHPSMIPNSTSSTSSSTTTTTTTTPNPTHRQTNESDYVISSNYPPQHQQNYYSQTPSIPSNLPSTNNYQQPYPSYIPSNYHPYNNDDQHTKNINNNNNNNNDIKQSPTTSSSSSN